MPTVSVNREQLFKRLGKNYTDEGFDELCFQFGIEIDDIVDDPEKGVTYKIDIGANRYDLLCIEGISRALNIFLGREKIPLYRLVPAKDSQQYKITVKPNTAKVRPFVVGAVLRNLHFTQQVYDSFIDLQDKLHQNLARKRTLASIGTHDLDTITGPFVYDAQPPQDISFVPLNKTEVWRSDKLLDHYLHDSHLKEYVPIIKDKPFYPVITDSKGVVLSLPPIINGDHSKITLNTRNVFIELTATDKFKAQITLDTLVAMFSEYCEQPFTVEPVIIEYLSGPSEQTPKLQYREQRAKVDYCNSLVGVEESAENIAKMLTSMSLTAKLEGTNTLKVLVPPTRYDILHPCDIAEDFGVAYGFDKLADNKEIPKTNTIGQEYELNYLSDKLRHLMAQNNYSEAATFSLCSQADMGEKMRVKLKEKDFVKIGNPKTIDTEALRITLLPGILKTVAANKHIPLPLRMFEVSDIVLPESEPSLSRGTGARNERHLVAINYNVRAGMEIVQGLLDNIMVGLRVPFTEDEGPKGYYLQGNDHPSYFPGFCGDVVVNSKVVGRIGLIHPEVITNFNLNNPAAALEINLEKLWKITNFSSQ